MVYLSSNFLMFVLVISTGCFSDLIAQALLSVILTWLMYFTLGRCSICLAEYHKEDVLRILPYCGHYFHIKCIDIWLLQHCTCPVCRISLRETNEKKRSMQFMSSSRSHLNTNFPSVSRFLSRTSETHRSDPMQENQLMEAARDNLALPEENVLEKHPTDKHVVCPSSAWLKVLESLKLVFLLLLAVALYISFLPWIISS